MLRKYKEKQYETRGYRTEADPYAGNVALTSSLCVHIQREPKDHLGILSPPRNQHSGWVQVICHIVRFINKPIDSRSHASILGHSLRLSLQNT